MSDIDKVIATIGFGITVTSTFALLCERIKQGTASEAEKAVISNFNTVIEEYAAQNMLVEKQGEAANIRQMQEKYNQKWGLLESGHIVGTIEPIETKKPHE